MGLTKVIELKMSTLPQHSLQNKITQTLRLGPSSRPQQTIPQVL